MKKFVTGFVAVVYTVCECVLNCLNLPFKTFGWTLKGAFKDLWKDDKCFVYIFFDLVIGLAMVPFFVGWYTLRGIVRNLADTPHMIKVNFYNLLGNV